MSYYKQHIFFCTNLRDNEKLCCSQKGSSGICKYTKNKLKSLNLSGVGGVRVSSSGCIGRCKLGPVLVIYPEQVWYTYNNESDIDEIIESYILQNNPVTRLLLSNEPKSVC